MSSFKEAANFLFESNNAPTEHGAAVDKRREQSEPKPTTEQEIRKCLICRSPFPSAWAGERICRRCKDTAAWRSGALK